MSAPDPEKKPNPFGKPTPLPGGDMPPDPVGVLTEAANSLHEFYISYRRAGFSSTQATYLVGCVVTNTPGPAPDGLDNPPA